MGRAQVVQQPVEGLGLTEGGGAAGGVGGRRLVAVVVPLHVADVVVAQQRVQCREQGVPHSRVGQIQHQLVAPGRLPPAGQAHGPIGMRPIHVAVGIDHLRFDPDPELQPQPAHVLDQRRQPVGVLGRVDGPVAKPGVGAVAAPEPSVVQHETLGPDRGRGRRQVLQGRRLVIEVNRFPGIEMHRARSFGNGRTADRAAEIAVEVLRQGVQSVGCEGRIDPRRGERPLGVKHDLARLQQRAKLDQAVAFRTDIGLQRETSAPGQMKAVDPAPPLVEPCMPDDQAGKSLQPGAASAVFAAPGAGPKGHAVGGEFPRPTPFKDQRLVAAAVQRETGRLQPMQRIGRGAGIGQGRAPADHVAGPVQRDLQHQPQGGDRVVKRQTYAVCILGKFAEHEIGGPVRLAARAFDRGPPQEPQAGLGHQRIGVGQVQCAFAPRGDARRGKRRRVGARIQRPAPVQAGGHAGAATVRHITGAPAVEPHEASGHVSPSSRPW